MIKNIVIIIVLFSSCLGNQNEEEKNRDSITHLSENKNQKVLKREAGPYDSTFLVYWAGFVDIVKNVNVPVFIEMSLDSIECNGKEIGVNDFIHLYFQKVFNPELRSRLNDSTKVDFSNFEIDSDAVQKYDWIKVKITSNIIKQVVITKSDKYPEGPIIMVLEFIQTARGYKFLGWKEFGSAVSEKT